ncbi:MAG: hypothetical protein IGQ45_03080 [Cyanobacterium sp. T60_A2020_053]|nr:hypothetical protein [Cyanobacterium sp. T60_A2020_053]
MLESEMKQIKDYFDFCNTHLKENQEQKRQYYCERLEKVLQLTIQFFKKYDVPHDHCFNFVNAGKYVHIFLLIRDDENTEWKINAGNKANSFGEGLTTEELVNYCWNEQVEMKNLINNLFSYIKQLMSKKKERMSKDVDKYNSEVSCFNEAIKNLQELIEIDIPEDIKNK